MTPDRQQYSGIELEAGDYIVRLDTVRLGLQVDVTRVEIAAKDPDRHTVDPGIVAAVSDHLHRIASEAVAAILAAEDIEPGSGSRTLSTDGGGSSEVVAAKSAILQRYPDATRDLVEAFAIRPRHLLTDEDFASIAAVVAQAEAERRPIQRAVAQARNVSRSRAGHLIKLTRDRGYLPPAGQRKRLPNPSDE